MLVTHWNASNSQANVKVKLDKFVEDHQQGRRESTVITVQTVDSLSLDDRVTWRTIRKELEEVGVTLAAFEANRDFIFRWLTHAIETGAFEEQTASDSEGHHMLESKSTDSDDTTSIEYNPPSIKTSAGVSADDKPPISHESPPDNPLPIVADKKQESRPEALPSANFTPLKPIVACQRCDKSNIAYELHMHCEHCKGGEYDLCLQCWHLGRGCLNWYGFGESAVARWNRRVGSRATDSLDCPFPHFLAGRRYRCVEPEMSHTSQGNGPDLIRKDSLVGDIQLQSGYFCSNCSAFARYVFWVCDFCNDGEWGYCVFCVNRGRCCTHPLLPMNLSTSPSENSIISQASGTVQEINTNCDICDGLISPFVPRFHCSQCNDGDYDVCSTCYHQFIEHGFLSKANGPEGRRLCLKDHRMIIFRFENSARGLRRTVIADLVGGHALNLSDLSSDSGKYLPSGGFGLRVIARWSHWPTEVDNDELAFPRGAEIRECENINDDWFWGIYCGRKGLFPGNLGEIIGIVGGVPQLEKNSAEIGDKSDVLSGDSC